MRHPLVATLVLSVAALSAGSARAHVGLAGPGIANTSQILTFTIGHGCEGADTLKLTIHIPAEVTTLRALPWVYGEGDVVTTSTAGTTVTWSKGQVRATDDQYYELRVRIKVPDMPFKTLYIPATQVCRDAMGAEKTVEWAALPGADPMDEPAPSLLIVPARFPGWNKYTIASDLPDLTMFKDAQIVWAGESAYSANPTTMELIKAEPGVTELTSVSAGTEVWVKY